MRKQRIAMIAGGCSAIIGVGWVVSPKELAKLDLGANATDAPAGGEVFTGPEVSNLKGTYQVAIVVVDGAVTDVRPLQAGTTDEVSVRVNEQALPELERRMLDAQSWDVEYVSGASYTSPAIVESAKGAFQQAGLD
jgi:uncharacterized protein with FMN-binding domain